MKKLLLVCAALLASVLVFGCATSVPVTVTRPAELDLHGAKTLSVLPFQTTDDKYGDSSNGSVIAVLRFFDIIDYTNPEEYESAGYLTSQLTQLISESQYVKLVNSSAVQAAIKNGTPIPADVYLTGHFTHYSSNVDPRTVVETDREGHKHEYRVYDKSVQVSVNYEVVDAKTNQVIAYRQKDLVGTSKNNRDNYQMPSSTNIIRPELEKLAAQIMKQIQPYTEHVYITLLSDKTKDIDMKAADELVKNGMIAEGKNKFYQIYTQKGLFEAGYNAAKLMQAQGDLYNARSLMQQLVTQYSDERAMKAVENLNYEIAQAEKLQKQTQQ